MSRSFRIPYFREPSAESGRGVSKTTFPRRAWERVFGVFFVGWVERSEPHDDEFWVGPTLVGPNPLRFNKGDGKARLKSDLPDSQFRVVSKKLA